MTEDQDVYVGVETGVFSQMLTERGHLDGALPKEYILEVIAIDVQGDLSTVLCKTVKRTLQ